MRKAGNKKYLSTFLFMLAMVFVFSARTPQTVQAMSKSTQHKLYKKTMQDYARKSKASYKRNSLYIGGSGSSKKVMYLFVDIDKNGTDELVMRYGNPKTDRNTAIGSGYGESTSIYTIKNGKVTTILDHSNVNPMCHDNFVHIFKNRSRIDMGVSHGYDDHTFCTYSKGKLYTNKNTIWMTCYNGKASYNRKPISLSSYRAKYKSLTNNEKGYTMKLYK